MSEGRDLVSHGGLSSEEAHNSLCDSLKNFSLCVCEGMEECLFYSLLLHASLTSGAGDWISCPNFSSIAIRNSLGLRNTW